MLRNSSIANKDKEATNLHFGINTTGKLATEKANIQIFLQSFSRCQTNTFHNDHQPSIVLSREVQKYDLLKVTRIGSGQKYTEHTIAKIDHILNSEVIALVGKEWTSSIVFLAEKTKTIWKLTIIENQTLSLSVRYSEY